MPDEHDDGAAEVRTFLIADVRGYTRFTQVFGDVAAGKLAARFAATVGDVVTPRGGTLLELRGDEALVVFASPRRAVESALVLQAELVERTLADRTLPLGVGIGIDAGEAVPVADGYRGAALNVAARLCSTARAGQVLASAAAVHLAGRVDGARYVDRGQVRLKGLDKPTTVMQVLPAGADPTTAPDFRAAVSWDVAAMHAATRRRRQVIVQAVAALVVLFAAVITLVARAGRVASLPFIGTDAVGRIQLSSDQLVARVPVGAGPGAIATDGRSLWVANAVDGTLSRIDLATPSAPANTIPLNPTAAAVLRPSGVAVGAGAVWVTDANNRQVDRVDPVTKEVVDRITVGNGPVSVAVGGGEVWVANSLDDTVSVVDPAADRLVASIPVAADPVAVAYQDGSVWVADAGSATVIRIDARTRLPAAVIGVGAGPSALACGHGAVWVANALDGTVSRIDPGQGRVVTTFPAGRLPDGLVLTGRTLWVLDGNGDSVWRVDTTRNRVVDTIPVGDATSGGVAARGGLWVTAAGSAAQHHGGTLRLLVNTGQISGIGNEDTLDPAYAYQLVNWDLISILNDGLVTFRRTGGTGGSQLVPDLATTLPAPTDNGLAYTFTLRPGIRFSSGRVVTPDDVKASFERAAVSGVPYFGGIVGVSRCAPAPRRCDLSRGIVVDDAADTVTFRLTAPDPAFLYKVATSFGAILPAGTGGADLQLALRPGTGPYEFTGVDRLAHGVRLLVLTRNPYFRQWNALAQPAGYPDRIEVTVLPQDQDDLGRNAAAVVAGRYDWSADGVDPPNLPPLLRSHSALLHTYQQPNTLYYFLNPHVFPFNDVRVRRAVNLALDRRALADRFGGPIFARPTCQVLPPPVSGFQPYCPYTVRPNPTGLWTGPDLAAARALVRAAGAVGAPVRIVGDPDPTFAPDDILRRTLLQLGLRATIQPFPNTGDQAVNLYYNYIRTPGNHVAMAATGWYTDYPAASNMFQLLLTCSSGHDPHTSNLGQFCDPRLDGVIQQALQQQQDNPAAATTSWAAADRIATDDAPWAFESNPGGVDIVSARVGDYQFQTEFGVIFDQLWVR